MLYRTPLNPPRAHRSEFGSRSARCPPVDAASHPPEPPTLGAGV